MWTDQAWRSLYPLTTAADDDWNVVMDCDQNRPPDANICFYKKEKTFASLAVSCHQDVNRAQVSAKFTPLVWDLNFSCVWGNMILIFVWNLFEKLQIELLKEDKVKWMCVLSAG